MLMELLTTSLLFLWEIQYAIVYMDDLKDLDIEKIGPKFENHIAFPDRINTEFVK